ncbi:MULTISPECIES: ImmA/IrrE family metallo-endopeptidase [Lysinibacillus]|uniref:ImmA/IrrE family metallo-endopeptidase n=1 Tax=Lysinibacillus capsici TaxID=2115968 RepID=A0ABY8KMG0_9BACI|nr:ImmA/IrrE family metallo-endopeptidase [Lysinibacillus capsici]MCT1538519.1 ImmA/IrrE family metallo-endopeptidase [Lysinibacillus capsici]MCT1569227.1 ImmA/IrrE family metallo-endopeptidase [Lysinibacillus capsici]MCT1646242.1 ImmA/IrrE family metallo-endopeptidase [Lysinibacillus capsici]MCT1725252.1 ImmA/IrrE family metallo-endopeptidase [Lysinibacillus capsici]MCT1784032.1 ImmA/IrrE family metallo-endopeptidase [Lysinibacillus capsici]
MGLSKAEIIKTATAEANRVLSKFDFSYTEPIDIFRIIEGNNIIINFQKIDKLAGAYIPETQKNRPGILINENLPITRQRYTAAHELCHYIRKDPPSLDTSSELFMEEYKRDEKEQIAEVFASCILMPRKLVNNILKQMGVVELTPFSVYELSLRMDTSYQATVNRLASLRIIKSGRQYQDLKSYSPKDVKNHYGKDGLETNWNNIWNINEQDNNIIIYPALGDEVRIKLEENPSTGYKWMGIPEIRYINSNWSPSDENILGAVGDRCIKLQIKDIKEMKLELFYNRPWLPKSNSIKVFKINIITQYKRHGIKLEQLIA